LIGFGYEHHERRGYTCLAPCPCPLQKARPAFDPNARTAPRCAGRKTGFAIRLNRRCHTIISINPPHTDSSLLARRKPPHLTPSPLCRSVLLVPTGDRLSRHLRVDRRYRRLITFSHEAYIQKRNPDPLRAPFVVCRSSPKLYLFSISRQNGTATLLFVRGAVYLTRESVSILLRGSDTRYLDALDAF